MALELVAQDGQFFARAVCDVCGGLSDPERSLILSAKGRRRVLLAGDRAVYGTTFLVCREPRCAAWLEAFSAERNLRGHPGPCSSTCPCEWAGVAATDFLLSLLSATGEGLLAAAAAAYARYGPACPPVVAALAEAAPTAGAAAVTSAAPGALLGRSGAGGRGTDG